jgi:hypothetical protein
MKQVFSAVRKRYKLFDEERAAQPASLGNNHVRG